jgi:archaemetzincin
MRKLSVFLLALLLTSCFQSETAKISNVKTEQTPQTTDPSAVRLFRIKDAVVPFFKPMHVEDGDWLKSFTENGQTFEEYLNCQPTLPTADRKIIYIQPLGDFTETERRVLQSTAEYMQAFYNLPVKLNSEKKLNKMPAELSRKNPQTRQKQIKTGYFLENLLPKMLPADGAALICFTDFDLYPDENWNYVFGQANLQTRVGVWSLSRLGEPDKSPEDYQKFLARTLKVGMHETGHMFSMTHCTKYECLMSGTNHLDETDRRPLDTCPECMAKIAWAMKYEPRERYLNLAKFWERQARADEQRSFTDKAEAVSRIAE